MNIVKRIQKANRGRDPEHFAMKHRALRASPFASLRGTGHLFSNRARCVAWARLRSSGRQGAANVDAPIDFAGRKKWRRALARATAASARQVIADWTTFAAAYDAGACAAAAQVR